ncbi:T9SS type A sorting domain-containing protein [Spirosoma taeanense]|uniref:T9SS type A sorting domain-containing protein n=1 Tax=Spirosoma taeanense TaxID=2735870 RepID=A0A6M5Y6Y9_9BACT|nr:T9SS type A sorting domain-containing protein [Spirosoma taeanense]QJW89655.1 T9SS type A sorting domain-containing protein [Spirosoma taeanense]
MVKLNSVLLSGLFLIPSAAGWAGTEDPCAVTLRLTQRISRGETRQPQAIQTLVATNVVDREALASYQAGRSLTLLPGFSAEQGSVFTAEVKSCTCNPLPSADLAAESENRLTLTAYPNPFTETTVIRYRLTEASAVSLSLLDEQGRAVDMLISGEMQEAGLHEYTYRNASSPAMVYLYSLRTNQGVTTKRLIKQR